VPDDRLVQVKHPLITRESLLEALLRVEHGVIVQIWPIAAVHDSLSDRPLPTPCRLSLMGGVRYFYNTREAISK
jgi:hypothetical protein